MRCDCTKMRLQQNRTVCDGLQHAATAIRIVARELIADQISDIWHVESSAIVSCDFDLSANQISPRRWRHHQFAWSDQQNQKWVTAQKKQLKVERTSHTTRPGNLGADSDVLSQASYKMFLYALDDTHKEILKMNKHIKA